jgi:hypothetical protein
MWATRRSPNSSINHSEKANKFPFSTSNEEHQQFATATHTTVLAYPKIALGSGKMSQQLTPEINPNIAAGN